MKIVLVRMHQYTPLELSYPALGVGYISAYTKAYSDFDDIIIVDGATGENPLERITQLKPDVIGISSTTVEFGETVTLTKRIKEIFPDIPIIIGGPHISMLPETLPITADVGVVGEGEQTFVEVLKIIDKQGINKELLKNVPGVVFHNDGIKLTEPRCQIEDMDTIPHPDLDAFDLKFYLKKRSHFPRCFGVGLSMMTSRGCIYRCRFCGSAHFWQKMRFHSAEYVVSEMKMMAEKYKLDFINIFDDIFNINPDRLQKIVSIIKEEKLHEKVSFGIQGRANMLSDDMCRLLKDMNVVYIGFGLESGSENVLGYLKKNTVTVEDNIFAIKQCRKWGFMCGSGFMVGNPGETMKDLKDTLNFINKYPLDSCEIYVTAPLPGTDLWKVGLEKGIVSNDMDWNKINQFFGSETVILNDVLDKEEFIKIYGVLKKAVATSKLKSNIVHPISLLKYVVKNPKSLLKVGGVF